MANISKNALVSYTRGKSTAFSRIRFNIPEEAKFTFPINELFKMDIIGFNVNNIYFREENNKFLIVMDSSIVKSKLIKAVFTFSVHQEIYNPLKILMNEETLTDDQEKTISLIKRVIETYPPMIQIIPKNN